jgi:hypothetical protein
MNVSDKYITSSSKVDILVELDKALFYKPEGRGFETRWGEYIFFFQFT